MAKKMLIDSTHKEETRVVVTDGNRLLEFDYESMVRKQLKGSIFLAKVTRVEPSLQAAFVNFGGNRHGFLPFSEIHPDYFRIPIADREAIIAEQKALLEAQAKREAEEEAEEEAREAARQNMDTDSAYTAQPDSLDEMDQPSLEPVETAYLQHKGESEDLTNRDHSNNTAPMSFEQELFDEDGMDTDTDTEVDLIDASSDDPLLEHDDAGQVSDLAETLDSNSDEDSDFDTNGIEGEQGEADPNENVDVVSDEQGLNHRRGRDRFQQRGRGRGRFQQRGRKPLRGRREQINDDNDDNIFRTLAKRYKIQEVIKRGQIMLVQVSKEERGNKGAAVTTYLSLPGRYCVLMPNSPRGGGVSRKIASFAERKRMRSILKELSVPEGMSVILRTAGVERPAEDIKRDLDYLLRLWDNIRSTTLESSAPAQIYGEGDLIQRSIRDIYGEDVSEIVVSGDKGYRAACDFMGMLMPDDVSKIQHYKDDKIPLFHRFQVENQIAEIGEPVVQLRSGGYIVIHPTEALVSVDVNSGRATKERHIEETALKTNLEAADEVARQLRLRDLGGLVVVDFIDMEDRRNNARVERRLRDALSSDRARVQMSRISNFGLLELSRQRLNPSLTEAQFQQCPHCKGAGVIRTIDSAAILALRGIEEEGTRNRSSQVILNVPSEIALYILNNKRDRLVDIERRYGFVVSVRVDETLSPIGYRLETVKTVQPQDHDEGDEIITRETMSELQPNNTKEQSEETADDSEVSSNRNRGGRNRGGRNRNNRGRDRFNNRGPRTEILSNTVQDNDTDIDDNIGNRAEPEPVDDDQIDNIGNQDHTVSKETNRHSRDRNGGGGRGRDRNGRDRQNNRDNRGGRNRPDVTRPQQDHNGPSQDSRQDNTPQSSQPSQSAGPTIGYMSRRRNAEQTPQTQSDQTASDSADQNGASDQPRKKGWWNRLVE